MQLPIVFISYSHEDKKWKDLLAKPLKVLEQDKQLKLWEDSRIGAGENWFDEIQKAMNRASVAVLLVSSNSLTSEFILRQEIVGLLQHQRDRGLRIYPVIVEPCPWKDVSWLKEMQVRPIGGKELSSYSAKKIKEVIIDLVTEIREILQTTGLQSSIEGSTHINPDDISIGRLPATGSNLFGRDDELRILDEAWSNRKTNIVSFVTWGGVGKSALVNHWLRRMREENYCGAQKVFGWSFYSQGTRDQASSGDLFIASALKWFGDPNPDQGDPEEKARRLAKLIRKRRTLLILDGLEPLQFPPGERRGRLKHPGIRLLLRELAGSNPGLCVVSSRLPVSDLSDSIGTSSLEVILKHLAPAAGREVLESEGAYGPDHEMEKASDEFGGHALALSILGHFLKMAAGGDIHQRDRIGPLTHDPERGGHARRVIESYARWFQNNLEQQVELESLQMMGLFDRPIEPGAWKVLIENPPIKGLTDHISNADETRWRYALAVLREAHLLTEMDPNRSDTIDCHALIREHFSEVLQKNCPRAWKQAHERLFKFFHPKTTYLPKTVEAMAPYYQAITHACFAGRHREAFNKVYLPYIRQRGAYNTDSLRAFGDDYAALNGFLQDGHFKVVSKLYLRNSFILGEIGFDLRALGRPDESIKPMEAALEWDESQKDFSNAAIQAAILSHTTLILGSIKDAVSFADRGASLAREAHNPYLEMINIGNRADAIHHAGDFKRASQDFCSAEKISRALFGEDSYLRSLLGYRYCDYLLTMGKYREVKRRAESNFPLDKKGGYPPNYSRPHSLLHATQIAGQVLPLALNHLARARAFLCEFTKKQIASSLDEAGRYLELAIEALESSSSRHEVPRGLLARAEFSMAKKDFDGAERDLLSVLSSSVTGGMRLYEANSHVGLAWLFEASGQQPKAREHLRIAHGLVERLGYGRLRLVVAATAKRLGLPI